MPVAKELALDTNVPLHLAAGREPVVAFHRRFRARGYNLQLPPTVLVELSALRRYGTAEQRALAEAALDGLGGWGLQPFTLPRSSVGPVESFARHLLGEGLLPEGELNDGRLLAETSLGKLPVLVTSDWHLLGLEPAALVLAFHQAGLRPVTVSHPGALLRALR